MIIPTSASKSISSITISKKDKPKSILRKSSTMNDFDFLQEKREERQFEITKNVELKKSINIKINEIRSIVKNKKVDFYPVNSTLNDSIESISYMDCRNDHVLSKNKSSVLANKENIQRDLSDYERISANTLLLTHNLNFL